ncbi:MAG: ADP-ribosylglycohydrolase family protein [Gammaproteobacteria bacterium]|nr:ADP-ribosylglycohydrolase family protein [Gammaproteobacteria bacterium]MBU0772782.1 ADP-ribosylglycohydrolase family protein [Gammaproteobacteria bacterium]MBU0855710.1 ADP-ribosylglycohydrolase family protein [Gammaproteobacteria bacterium]MBU1847021.1 ADP-ribosylglycohydrolase family protein [Gammaproteobacteria bacterium]
MIDPSRFEAAWWGSFIGDALAMPVHWYYTRERIATDYGTLTGYVAPHNPHPDSALSRSSYTATGATDDILHEQAVYWGGPSDIHYHQFLAAGENTLNVQIAALLAHSLIDCGGYDQSDFARRYIDFMLTAGSHRDTYVESSHRSFFRHYAEGRELDECGVEDSNIGGLATLTPLVLLYASDRDAMQAVVREHIALTHKGPVAAEAAAVFADLLFSLVHGSTIDEAMTQCGRTEHAVLDHPWHEWADTRDDNDIIGNRFSPACKLADSLPATLHLAVKYEHDARGGLLANVRAGGDNCHRGVVLGALLGAAGGMDALPPEWVRGLHAHAQYQPLVEALRRLALS